MILSEVEASRASPPQSVMSSRAFEQREAVRHHFDFILISFQYRYDLIMRSPPTFEKNQPSACIGSSQSPQISRVSGFAQAFAAQAGQVYFVLLAAFFFRAASSAHNST